MADAVPERKTRRGGAGRTKLTVEAPAPPPEVKKVADAAVPGGEGPRKRQRGGGRKGKGKAGAEGAQDTKQEVDAPVAVEEPRKRQRGGESRKTKGDAADGGADGGQEAKKPKKAADGGDGSTGADAKPEKKSNPPSKTVFVGQLAFNTTTEELTKHFAAVAGMTRPPVSVRLLAQKDSGKSRGMAFVQLAVEADVHTALKALHKSILGGRRINVERTVGGGGSAPARVDKIKNLRTIQDGAINRRVQQLVDSVVAEFGGDEEGGEAVESMGLRESDVDEVPIILYCIYDRDSS
ncbi:hypothetical protein T492DRAFT_114444 [Pavlovales sp. CCMP2436]|nr:hypothetical protein T492DRAFT_114444 [Pavlovales sp. CCMP2436]